RRGGAMVRHVRAARAGRGGGEAQDAEIRARRAGHGQGEEDQNGGLRGRWVPAVQGRRRDRLAAPRAVRPRRRPALRGPHLIVQGRRATQAPEGAPAAGKGERRVRGRRAASGGPSRWTQGRELPWV